MEQVSLMPADLIKSTTIIRAICSFIYINSKSPCGASACINYSLLPGETEKILFSVALKILTYHYIFRITNGTIDIVLG